MRATEPEFRYRFWIIGAIYGLGFGLYRLDHTNLGRRLVHALGPGAGDLTRLHRLQLVMAGGAGLVVLAALLRTWAAAYLDPDIVHDAVIRHDRVVADGPFRFVRNPLYLGVVLLTLGMAPMASPTGAAFMVVGLVIFLRRLIGREEAELEASQGDAFRRYRDRVPRLLPALTPRLPASGAHPRWRKALGAEVFVWAFVLGAVLFAITLDFQLTWPIWLAGIVVYQIQKRVGRPRPADGFSDGPA